MRFPHLAKGVLQYQRIAPGKHRGSSRGQRGRVIPGAPGRGRRMPTPISFHLGIDQKGMKQADGVRAAAHACHGRVRQPGLPSSSIRALGPRGRSQPGSLAHQVRIGVRPPLSPGSNTCHWIRHPIALRLVDGGAQRLHRRLVVLAPTVAPRSCMRPTLSALKVPRRPRPCKPHRVFPAVLPRRRWQRHAAPRRFRR